MTNMTTLQSATVAAGRRAPTHTAIAEFRSYRDAQHLVDRLSDAGFPVQSARIVGHDVHTVEQVTGRLTTGRAALVGAATGAWIGLLIGVLLTLFTAGAAPIATFLASLFMGAGWGAVLGSVGHWVTRGRRDFSSVKRLDAGRYQVQVEEGVAAEARAFTRAA
jgi:hypothetical protein